MALAGTNSDNELSPSSEDKQRQDARDDRKIFERVGHRSAPAWSFACGIDCNGIRFSFAGPALHRRGAGLALPKDAN